MSFTLWCSSSSLEAIEPYPDGFRPNRKRAPLPKAFVRPVRQDELRKHGHDATHKAAMVSSRNLVPEGLREMSKSDKKSGEETNYNVKCIRTLLIDNYDSYTYNIYQELSVINKVPPIVVRNDEWTWEEACFYLYEERAFDNIVISPGPGSPMCVSDIGLCLQLLRKCTDIPILGVCLGHQALAYAHGAQIVHAVEPIHGRLRNSIRMIYSIARPFKMQRVCRCCIQTKGRSIKQDFLMLPTSGALWLTVLIQVLRKNYHLICWRMVKGMVSYSREILLLSKKIMVLHSLQPFINIWPRSNRLLMVQLGVQLSVHLMCIIPQ